MKGLLGRRARSLPKVWRQRTDLQLQRGQTAFLKVGVSWGSENLPLLPNHGSFFTVCSKFPRLLCLENSGVLSFSPHSAGHLTHPQEAWHVGRAIHSHFPWQNLCVLRAGK